MKTPPFLKILLRVAALLLSLGTLSHLAAQDASTFATASTTDTVPIAPRRTYTGTATLTTAAGVTTTGTFTLYVLKKGALHATPTFNGVSASYEGGLATSYSSFTESPDSVRRKVSGFVSTPVTVTNPDGSMTISALPLPLMIYSSITYGGMVNEDGSVLSVRAVRDAK